MTWGLMNSALANESSAPGFRIVVHPDNPVASASPAFLADAFLKRVTRWPGGALIRAVDQKPTATVRQRFSEAVLKRTVAAVRRSWQQKIFSGRDVPPPELDSDVAVVAFVERNPGAVGYVSAGVPLGRTHAVAVK